MCVTGGIDDFPLQQVVAGRTDQTGRQMPQRQWRLVGAMPFATAACTAVDCQNRVIASSIPDASSSDYEILGG